MDLEALGNLSKNVEDRLAWLRNTFGKTLRLGCSMDLVVTDEPSFIDVMWLGYPTLRITRTSFSGKARAGAMFRHRLERLNGLEGEIRAYSSALGLTNPAGVAWEAIPYSFVADWFTKVGERTKQIAFSPFPGEWEIWNVTHSFTTEVTFVVDELPYPGGTLLGPQRVGSGRIVRYERNVGMPTSSSVIADETLDMKQQLLAAALLGARM
jgi:hypothetical protein